MNIEKYTEEVAALKKSGMDILKELTIEKASALHMLTGLTDEFFELGMALNKADFDNVREELGDMMFYLEGLLQDLRTVPASDCEQITVSDGMALIVEIVKRHAFYGQALRQEELSTVAGGVLKSIEFIASSEPIGCTLDDLRQQNIDKLHKRYAAKQFSNEAATERADKAETIH
jgi:NTP pyrophosphatase (non-canonical NTP hydrolase)